MRDAVVLSFLLIGACLPPELADDTGTDVEYLIDRGVEEVSPPARAVDIGCLADSAWGECQALLLDASAATIAGEEVVSWRWSLDGVKAATPVLEHHFQLPPLAPQATAFSGVLYMKSSDEDALLVELSLAGTLIPAPRPEGASVDAEALWLLGIRQRPAAEETASSACFAQVSVLAGAGLAAGTELSWLDERTGMQRPLLSWEEDSVRIVSSLVSDVQRVSQQDVSLYLRLPSARGRIALTAPGVPTLSLIERCPQQKFED